MSRRRSETTVLHSARQSGGQEEYADKWLQEIHHFVPVPAKRPSPLTSSHTKPSGTPINRARKASTNTSMTKRLSSSIIDRRFRAAATCRPALHHLTEPH